MAREWFRERARSRMHVDLQDTAGVTVDVLGIGLQAHLGHCRAPARRHVAGKVTYM